jgi:predicted TIM-barrel fold metal-dependent hydrolase
MVFDSHMHVGDFPYFGSVGALQVREAVERVGPDRVLFGSDAPFHHLTVELAKVRVSGLPDPVTDAVLGTNGQRLFFGSTTPDVVG